MIAAYLWDRQARKLQPAPPDLLQKAHQAVADANQVLWVDLSAPTAEEEALVLQRFLPVHPLTFEDVTRLRREPDAPPHFPKVEEFNDYLFVIVNPLTHQFLHSLEKPAAGDAASAIRMFTQLSAVLTHHILVTHHYEPLVCIDQLNAFLQRHETQADRGPDYLFHLILDSTVDQYAPVLDYVDDRLDEMEIAVISRPRPGLLRGLLHLKRRIVILRKTLIYEREVLVRLARGEFDLVEDRETAYYRNVYDHLVRFAELMESSRDMASDLMQSYLAATSNHLNQIMKYLTMVSTVILPMTLISGIYGMNFEGMPELKWEYGYPFALGLMALTGVASLAFFWWRKWI
jgi:magnesium transporter